MFFSCANWSRSSDKDWPSKMASAACLWLSKAKRRALILQQGLSRRWWQHSCNSISLRLGYSNCHHITSCCQLRNKHWKQNEWPWLHSHETVQKACITRRIVTMDVAVCQLARNYCLRHIASGLQGPICFQWLMSCLVQKRRDKYVSQPARNAPDSTVLPFWPQALARRHPQLSNVDHRWWWTAPRKQELRTSLTTHPRNKRLNLKKHSLETIFQRAIKV